MRRDRGHDQVVPCERLDERPGPREPLFGSLRVRHRELDDRLPQDAAQPGGPGHLRDLLLEVVHVRVGRRAGLDHLERGQARPDPYELGRDGLGLGREDVFLQPVHQREIVGEPAVHHHRRVGVGVDEPGQHDLRPGVDRFGGRELRGNRGRCIDVDDVGAGNRDGAWRDDSMRGILGKDGAADHDQRHRPPRRLRRKDRDGRERQDNDRFHALRILSAIHHRPLAIGHLPSAISHQP